MEEKGSIGQFTKMQRKDSLFGVTLGMMMMIVMGHDLQDLYLLESHTESVPVITLQKDIIVKEQVTEPILICRECA